MPSQELLDQIEEAGEGQEDLFLLEPREEFDQFIVGLAVRGHEAFVVYDRAGILEHLATEETNNPSADDYDPSLAALEHFDFNMNQAGEGKPAYITLDDAPSRS